MKEPAIDRDWIREFTEGGAGGALVREVVIQERDGNYFDIFQTYPDRLLLTRLTLDEALGYAALAIAAGRGPRLRTIEQERRSWAFEASLQRPLEPWQKQLPENASA